MVIDSALVDRSNIYSTGLNRSVFITESALQNLIVFLNDTTSGNNLFQNNYDFLNSIRYYPINRFFNYANNNLIIGKVQTNIPVDFSSPLSTSLLYIGYSGEFAFDGNDFALFNGYRKIKIFLPYYGFVDIQPNDVCGKFIVIYLNIDYSTGQGTYYIVTTTNRKDIPASDVKYVTAGTYNGVVISTVMFNLGIDIPLARTNSTDVSISKAVNTLNLAKRYVDITSAPLVGASHGSSYGIAGSIVGAALETRKSVVNNTVETAQYALENYTLRSETESPKNSANMMGISDYVKIIIYEPNILPVTGEFTKLNGLPVGTTHKLSDCHGYTEISDVHIEGEFFETITDEERALLYNTLTSGVIL